jgi:hypothetical protein
MKEASPASAKASNRKTDLGQAAQPQILIGYDLVQKMGILWTESLRFCGNRF